MSKRPLSSLAASLVALSLVLAPPAGRAQEGGAPAPQNATPAQTGQQNAQPGTGGMNPATGQGPQSAVHGPARNRPVDVVHVDSVKRVAGTCDGMQ